MLLQKEMSVDAAVVVVFSGQQFLAFLSILHMRMVLFVNKDNNIGRVTSLSTLDVQSTEY